jgi:L-histidine Nalpha-methyltransferase
MDHTERSSREAVEELKAGFSVRPRILPPKFFYDETGSALFEEITTLPEYYPTRTERALLERWVPEWVRAIRPGTVLELGAGSAEKTRVILDAVSDIRPDAVFVPVDISAEFLADTARRIGDDYPRLDVRPVVGDLVGSIDLPADLPRPAMVVFLGSTIGNFEADAAVSLLSRVGAWMGADDSFVIGFDLVKDARVLEAAYDDSRGVTARFNLNMLSVLNDLTGSDFDPARFSHLSFFNREESRIEMHLVSEADQTVSLPDGTRWELEEGETIRTEISCKYERETVESMLAAAGLRIGDWVTDPDEYYALARICH